MSDAVLIFSIESHIYAIPLDLCSRKCTLKLSNLSVVEKNFIIDLICPKCANRFGRISVKHFRAHF